MMLKGRGVPVVLLLLVLVLRPHMAGSAFPFAQGLLLIPVLVGFALVLLSPEGTGPIPRRLLPVLTLPCALFIWSLVTLFWTHDPGQGVRECVTLLGNITAFYLLFLIIRKTEEFEAMSVPVLGLATVPVLASALYQRFVGLARIRVTLLEMEASGDPVADLAPIIGSDRVFAGFLNPNMLAGFLAIGICLSFDLFLTVPDRKRRAFLAALTGMQCVVLVLTGSVGGSIAAVTMTGAVLLVRRRFRYRDLAAAGAVLLIMTGGILAVRGGSFLFGPESSLLQRGGYVAAGIRMAEVHPVLGWGSGAGPGALMGFVSEGVRPVADPHNFLVGAWISWGLPGLLILVSFLLFWFAAVVRSAATAGLGHLSPGFAGLAFGSLAFLGHSLLDMDFSMPETALFGWCALGAALGLTAVYEKDAGARTVEPGKGFLTAVGAAALVMVLPVFIFLQGESLGYRAGKAAAEGDHLVAARLYREARTLLPMNGRFALDEGRTRYAAGDAVKADELFLKAGTLMEASPYPPWEMGRSALQTGQWARSIPWLETALDRYPTSPRIRIDLARAYLNLGDAGRVYSLLQEARRFAVFDPVSRDLAERILGELER